VPSLSFSCSCFLSTSVHRTCAAAAALFLGIENLMGFVAIFGADPLPTLC
jgi:hypothetical protein